MSTFTMNRFNMHFDFSDKTYIWAPVRYSPTSAPPLKKKGLFALSKRAVYSQVV